jgi:DGQHR domain-containing protein
MIIIQDSFSDSVTLLKKEKKRRQEPNFNADELFENQLWEFLYLIGFNKLNIGRECEVKYGKDHSSLITKKIDIIAESHEARLYIECTTQIESTSKIKNWSSDCDSIRKYEATNEDTKDKNVVFVYFTTQALTNAEKLKLKEKGISLLNPKILEYFKELIKLYKNLAYYQFLSYLLNGKVIKTFEKSDFEIPAIRCKYKSGDYCYLFGIKPSVLIPLSSVLHRKMEVQDNISESYQRLVKAQKIKEIKKFISEERGVFPTNIIISFDTKTNDYFKAQGSKINDIQFGILTLPRQYQSITIIDGQHRLFAYDGLEQAERDLIYVVAFHNLSAEKQVQTFININEKQTKVSASLMWDLYPSILDLDDVKLKISNLVKNLNKDSESALYGVIQYDSAEYSPKGSKITLESICTAIKSENVFGVIGGILDKNEIKLRRDEIIYKVFIDYFNTIQNLNPEHWNRNEKTKNLLRSNQGIGAFIKLLKEIINYIDSKGSFKTNYKDLKLDDWYKTLLSPVNNLILSLKTTEDIKRFKRIGEGGKQQIFVDFVKHINKSFPDFGNNIIERQQNEELEKLRAELIENGEHNTIEAKESFFSDTKRLKKTGELHQNSDDAIRGIIKTVVAFSNYKGGNIVIGLNDPAFDYIGIDSTDLKLKKDWDTLKQAIGQKIDSETKGLTRRPEILKINHNSKTFAVIRVKALDKKRFEEQDLALMTFDNNCYKRENGDSVIIITNEIKKYCNFVLKELEEEENSTEEESEE